MGASSGLALRALQWFIRAIQFCCAAIVLALYSYFLATQHNHGLTIWTYERAVEGVAGAAVLYTLIGLVLLCCLAGHTLFSLIAIVLDICFVGAFIYVAQANRAGTSSCNGVVNTPLGTGSAGSQVSSNSSGFTHLPTYRTACRMTSAVLAVSIVAIIFFLASALMEIILVRHHRKEKRFGPGPQNNYTSGYGRRGLFGFRRGRRANPAAADTADPNALPEHAHPGDIRDSYGTEATAVGHEQPPSSSAGAPYNKYESGYGYAGNTAAANEPTPAPAHYPPANYRYEDGVYNA